MSEVSYTSDVARDIVNRMEQRVEEIMRSFPVPPGFERFDDKAEAARRFFTMSGEDRADMLLRYQNVHGPELGTMMLAQDMLGGR